MVDRTSRRTVLRAVGAGVAVGLAGCSGGDDSSSGTTEPGGNDTLTETSTGTKSPTSTESSESTATETQEDPIGEDNQYAGEQAIESPSTNPLLSEEDYWIELEHTSEQVSTPVNSEFLSYVSRSSSFEDETFNNGATVDLSAFYLVLTPESDDMFQVQAIYLNANGYDPETEFVEQLGQPGDPVTGGSGGYSAQDVRTMFSEDVTGYDDVSEDFPQEYLDLISD